MAKVFLVRSRFAAFASNQQLRKVVPTLTRGSAARQTDRDAVSKRIRLQFIKREIETAFNLVRLALSDSAVEHSDRAVQARRRARKTYEDFRAYLPLVAHQLTGVEKIECERGLDNLNRALQTLG